MNTVDKQAAIDWLKDRKAKNAKMRDELAAKGDYMHAALAQDNVSEINAVLIAFESGRFDSPSVSDQSRNEEKTERSDNRRLCIDFNAPEEFTCNCPFNECNRVKFNKSVGEVDGDRR